MLRLAAGDHRRDEDAHRQEAGGDEEQGQLQVPGPREVVGEPIAEVEAVEAARLDVVVGVGAAQESLQQEQPGDHQEIPGRGPLRRRQADFFRRAKAKIHAGLFLLDAMPAQQIVAPDHEQHQAAAAQQADQAEHAPEERLGRGLVSGQRLGRPIVGVGIVRARALRRRHPRRPGKIRGQPVNLVRIGDRRTLHAPLAGRVRRSTLRRTP